METFTLGWRERHGLQWLAWEGAGACAAFPGREGGVSPAPYDSLNLGLSVADEAGNVVENRRRFSEAIGLSLDRVVVPGQVHGTTLTEVGETHAGRGTRDAADVIAKTDALVTPTRELGLAVSYADCVPVVIVARDVQGAPLLATVHAGWRGMLGGVVREAAGALSRRGRLLGAVIGPSIGPCCFSTDDELRARFASRFPGSAGATTVDLWRCARLDLEAAGVPPGAITASELCTASDPRFFSHRRDHGLTGRHLAIAWLQGRTTPPSNDGRGGGTT